MNATIRGRQLVKSSTLWSVCLSIALAAACGGEKPAARPDSVNGSSVARNSFRPLAVGDTMAAYSVVSLAGDTLQFGRGKNAPLTILNVWATWCTSCREEMADLEALHREFQPKGVRIVGVSVDEASIDRVRGYVANEKLTFTIAHDQEGIVQRTYQISGVPATFIIASDGRLLWKTVGNLHGVVDSLRNVLVAAQSQQ